ncbi:zf-C2H2_4 domain-containing protein/zf-C2H2_6 domain-containing protein, partial [Cephalotus follicularis]
GRVLGGHTRHHHMALKSVKEEEKRNETDVGSPSGACGSGTSYVLREHPKKSSKFAGFNYNTTTMEEVVCSVCGKEFESERALFGHMKLHSKRGRKAIHCEECGKGYRSMRCLANHMKAHVGTLRVSNEARVCSTNNLVVESLSDTETVNLVRRKRSRRMRYNVTSNDEFSSLNMSDSGFEIEQEVKEVAICLMMLSRDKCNWRGFNPVNVSPSNDSFTYEVESLNQNKRIARNEVGDYVCDGDVCFERKKPKIEELDTCVLATENVLYEKKASQGNESDSGVLSDEEVEARLQVPVVSFYCGVGLKMPEVVDVCGSLLYTTESDKRIYGQMELKLSEAQSSDGLIEEGRADLAGSDSLNCSPVKKASLDACDAELQGNSCKKVISTSLNSFKCRTCNRIFHSYQALGGHQTGHRTSKSHAVLNIGSSEKDIKSNISTEIQDGCKHFKLEFDENSVEEMDEVRTMRAQLKESKGHKCPICSKVFVSGPALGGHKRIHCNKSSNSGEKLYMVMKQELSDISDVGDLKSPDIEAKADSKFMQWCAESDCNHLPG